MTDSGLSTRLRQQSRRAGLMVGLTMVLAIVICVFGAAGLFAWLSRPFSDLIPMVAPAAELQQPEAPENVAAAQVDVVDPAPDVPADQAGAAPLAPTAVPGSDDFEPTHQIAAGDSINFRAGPSTAEAIILALSPATPLQYLEEEAPTTNSADGARWMRFRNDGGAEGWVREIDTGPYVP